jgi:hypothetical protein
MNVVAPKKLLQAKNVFFANVCSLFLGWTETLSGLENVVWLLNHFEMIGTDVFAIFSIDYVWKGSFWIAEEPVLQNFLWLQLISCHIKLEHLSLSATFTPF